MKSRWHNRAFDHRALQVLESRIAPAGAIALVSRADPGLYSDAAGGISSFESLAPQSDMPTLHTISDDGRYTVYMNSASNLIAGQSDLNQGTDIFLYDRVANTTALVSHGFAANNSAGNRVSANASISADGRYVAFESFASDLIAGFADGNGTLNSDVYLYDRVTGMNNLVSHQFGSLITGGNGGSYSPIICANGSVIGYTTRASDVVAGFIASPSNSYNLNAVVFDRALNATSLASHSLTSTFKSGGDLSEVTDISADGRFTVFPSYAMDIVASSIPTLEINIFIYDRTTGNNTLVSRSATTPGSAANRDSFFALISADGNYVTYHSRATDLVSGFSGAANNFRIYVYDRVADTNVLASHSFGAATAGGTGYNEPTSISADGRYVTYHSRATDIVSGFIDNNSTSGFDVFLYDRVTNTNQLVSAVAGTTNVGGNANTDSYSATISGDGRFVVFSTLATNLVAGFTPGLVPGLLPEVNGTNVFLYDRVSATNVLVSHAVTSMTQGANAGSTVPYITADGQFVTFVSLSTDQVAGLNDANLLRDQFIYQRSTGVITLVSRRGGAPSQSGGGFNEWINTSRTGASQHSVSGDGRYAVFTSGASNMVAGQTGGLFMQQVFLYDRTQNSMQLVSHIPGSANTAANGSSADPALSADGRYVYFISYATDLVAGFVDGNGSASTDLYVFDRVTVTVGLVSHQFGSMVTGGNLLTGDNLSTAYLTSVSGDGRYLAYTSYATDLIAGFVDNNFSYIDDFYLYDRVTNMSQLVSHDFADQNKGGNGVPIDAPSISSDGRFIAYTCQSNNVVAATYVGGRNIVLFDRDTGINTLVSFSVGAPTTTSNGASDLARISCDGKFIAWEGTGTDVVIGQVEMNPNNDVFLYDRLAGTNTLVTHAAGLATTTGTYSSVTGTALGGHVISADGRFIAFASRANNLIPGFVNASISSGVDTGDIFIYDRDSGTNALVSHADVSLVQTGNRQSEFLGAISDDGRFVTYTSLSSDIVPGGVTGPSGNRNSYIYDRATAVNTLMSRHINAPAQIVIKSSEGSTISGDGTVAYFVSFSDDMVEGDFNDYPDIFSYSNLPAIQSTKIADGTSQRSIIRSLTLSFDQQVTFTGDPAAAFVVTRSSPTGPQGNVGLSASVTTSGGMTTVTLSFAGTLTQFGSLIDGTYKLTALAGQISAAGPLDGDNNGFGGDDYVLTFHRLFGDADGNRAVDAVDFTYFRLALGGSSFAFDLDGDGNVNVLDFIGFRNNFGMSI